METFWQKLPKPFFVSAPMKDVTDAAFRALLASCGKPDVTFTEFVSADGLYHTLENALGMNDLVGHSHNERPTRSFIMQKNPLLRDLQFTDAERPIVAQLFSAKPEMIAYGARLAKELGFDGVDLNMGCPDRAVEKQGAGAALIKSPALARELIRAAKTAGLPVSVKTRVGYSKEMLEEWLPELLAESPAAITIHLRTRKELSLVPAKWKLMQKAVAIRDKVKPSVLLIGNGDVASRSEGERLAKETDADGIMIGRGMFGNPWVFSKSDIGCLILEDKLKALVTLAREYEKLMPKKDFAILKKHIKAFVGGFRGAAEFRALLMTATNAEELAEYIAAFAETGGEE